MIMIVWFIVIAFIVLKLATSVYNPPKKRKNKHHYSDSGSSGYTDSGWSFWGTVPVPIATAGAEEAAIVPEEETGRRRWRLKRTGRFF